MSTTPRMTLEWVDPKTIIIDTNVRTIVDIDPAFFESIRDYGVQTPASCWRDEDNKIHVERGQRRVITAVRAERDEIPVLIMPKDMAIAERDRERERIIGQIIENDQRSDLADSERAAGFQQLTLFGMSADEIARATKTKRDKVRSAVRLVKEAPNTLEAMAEKQLTIDEALILSEFENDAPEREQLQQAIENTPHLVDQFVGKLRAERNRRLAHEELRAEARKQKVKWADPEKVGRWSSPYEKLDGLRIGKNTEAPTVEEAREQGGLVASAVENREWEKGVVTISYELEYFVEDPKEHGYRKPRDPNAQPVSQAEQDRKRKEREEKRRIKEVWGTACELRQTYIRDTLLTQKQAPEGVQLWILKALLAQKEAYGAYTSDSATTKARALALTWLGAGAEPADDSWRRTRAGFLTLAAKRPGQSEMIVALAYVLALAEIPFSDPKGYYYGKDNAGGAYLRQLQTWGYTLTEHEQGIVREWEKQHKAQSEAS